MSGHTFPVTALAVSDARAACRAWQDLIGHRVSLANQLRAHLQRSFPGPVGLFTEIDSPINLRFLAHFDCQDRAEAPTS